MMGHIHNLLLSMVKEHHGDAGVKKLFSLSGLTEQDFHSDVVYPEEMFQSLYGAAKKLYGADDDGAQKAFSDYFIRMSPKMFPYIFEEAGSARALLERVPLIHQQWPSAASANKYRQKVFIISSDSSKLVFKYDSPNHLCGVLKYVAQGVLDYYKEKGEVVETQCALKGSPWCQVEISFYGKA